MEHRERIRGKADTVLTPARTLGISPQEETEIRQTLGDEMFERFIAAAAQKLKPNTEFNREPSPARRKARSPEGRMHEGYGKERERRFDLVCAKNLL
jgi:hypothetical protein